MPSDLYASTSSADGRQLSKQSRVAVLSCHCHTLQPSAPLLNRWGGSEVPLQLLLRLPPPALRAGKTQLNLPFPPTLRLLPFVGCHGQCNGSYICTCTSPHCK